MNIGFDFLIVVWISPDIEESELVWPCYECLEKFRTEPLLQKHLESHDGADGGTPAETETASELSRRQGQKARRRSRVAKQSDVDNKDTLKEEVC